MRNRRAAADPRVPQLIAGWFRERHKYSAWRPNGTGDWLLVYTVHGRGRFGYADGEMVTQPGDIVLIRPGTPHDYGLEPQMKKWELLWTHFHPRPHWMDWLNWPATSRGPMRLRLNNRKQRARVQRRFVDVVTLANAAARRRDDLAMNALEELLLWCDAANPASHTTGIDPRVQAAMDHICRNPAAPITLSSLADVSGLSVSRLAHLFSEQTGVSPQQFLERQRINRARQLLQLTAMSVKSIAAEVGYESPFYFTLRFKRQMGASPREYRRRFDQP